MDCSFSCHLTGWEIDTPFFLLRNLVRVDYTPISNEKSNEIVHLLHSNHMQRQLSTVLSSKITLCSEILNIHGIFASSCRVYAQYISYLLQNIEYTQCFCARHSGSPGLDFLT